MGIIEDLDKQRRYQEELDSLKANLIATAKPFAVDEVARLYEVGIISKREARRLLGIEEPQKYHNSHNQFMDQIVEK